MSAPRGAAHRHVEAVRHLREIGSAIRRLQSLGAVAIKNSVYTLPLSAETQEDFEWLLREIRDGGGDAVVCEAKFLDGMTDHDVRTLFERARDAEPGDDALHFTPSGNTYGRARQVTEL